MILIKIKKIVVPSPLDNSIDITINPIYILNLRPHQENISITGKIYEDYQKNFKSILVDIIAPVTGLCNVIGGGRQSLSGGLDGFNSVIDKLNTSLDSLFSIVTKYISNYKSYILIFGYKVNFSLFVIIIGATFIEFIFYIIYFFYWHFFFINGEYC